MTARDKLIQSIRKLVAMEESLSSFAKKISASPQNVSNWLKGRSAPDIDKIAEICLACNVTMQSVFDGEPAFDYSVVEIDKDTKELVELYHGLPDDKKQVLMMVARSL